MARIRISFIIFILVSISFLEFNFGVFLSIQRYTARGLFGIDSRYCFICQLILHKNVGFAVINLRQYSNFFTFALKYFVGRVLQICQSLLQNSEVQVIGIGIPLRAAIATVDDLAELIDWLVSLGSSLPLTECVHLFFWSLDHFFSKLWVLAHRCDAQHLLLLKLKSWSILTL